MAQDLMWLDGIDETHGLPSEPHPAARFLPAVEAGGQIRSQAIEIINSVLGPDRASGSEAAVRLRGHLSAHPKQPERALLEHLMETGRINHAGNQPCEPSADRVAIQAKE